MDVQEGSLYKSTLYITLPQQMCRGPAGVPTTVGQAMPCTCHARAKRLEVLFMPKGYYVLSGMTSHVFSAKLTVHDSCPHFSHGVGSTVCGSVRQGACFDLLARGVLLSPAP